MIKKSCSLFLICFVAFATYAQAQTQSPTGTPNPNPSGKPPPCTEDWSSGSLKCKTGSCAKSCGEGVDPTDGTKACVCPKVDPPVVPPSTVPPSQPPSVPPSPNPSPEKKCEPITDANGNVTGCTQGGCKPGCKLTVNKKDRTKSTCGCMSCATVQDKESGKKGCVEDTGDNSCPKGLKCISRPLVGCNCFPI